ncbi:hypothetical protein [Spongiactinospora gelatinilytica]|uniref:hypothetical protein n=1 Tax=Spongiactinospora gelatinilytica TaxID=2666298 RepID=UPI0011B94497|nr:hypothetical protein [Spongiactinospora gelatinilytica]
MPFRRAAAHGRRRLSRTRVEQAVRETQTRLEVHSLGDTETLDDGRKQVLVHLLDTFTDPAPGIAGRSTVDRRLGG